MQKILFAFVLLFSGLAYGQEKPNVILITVDDLNRWIGAMGGPAITPNIDSLAAEGVLFTNAHSTFPACNPSRASFLTGLRPEVTGQFSNNGNFRNQPGGEDLITLPQFYRNEGYEAIAAGKIFHKPRGGNQSPLPESDPQSWDEQWVGFTGTNGKEQYLNEDGLAKWHNGEVTGYLGQSAIWGPVSQPTEQTGDWRLADFAADYLKEEHDKPFFLAVGIFRPHAPHIAPQEFFDLYPIEEVPVPELPADDMEDIPGAGQTNFSSAFVDVVKEKEQLQLAMQGYLASISFADACIGQLLQSLKQSAYADNTIVILTSDHGFQLGHKNRWEKFSLWNLGTQSPLIIKFPGMTTAGQQTDESVSLLDIYPTALDLSGMEIPEYLQGNSLKPLLDDPGFNWPHAAVVTYPEGSHAVKKKKWDYILYSNGEEELYNLDEDPNEYTNLIGNPEYDSIVAALKPYTEIDDQVEIPDPTPEVIDYHWPEEAGRSDKYKVYIEEVDGVEKEVEVLMSEAIWEGDWKQDELKGRTFSFVNLSYRFEGNNPLNIRIEKLFGEEATAIEIHPESYNLRSLDPRGKEAEFKIRAEERYLSVLFDGPDNRTANDQWIKHMLCIFIDPMETEIPERSEEGVIIYNNNLSAQELEQAKTIYFESGYHNLKDFADGGIIDSDGVLTLKNNQEVYLEGGAFVEGLIDVENRGGPGHKVFGRGILSGRQYLWKNHPDHSGREFKEIIRLGNNANIDGITVMESPFHGIVGRTTTISHLKFLGWHSNNDAIRVGSDSEISHSFIRAVDDHFYNFDIWVHDVVLWAGHNGAILTYGWGGLEAPTYNAGSSILENIDIIHPEWINLGNNNGLVASQVGFDFKPFAYNDSTTTVLRNIVIEGDVPGLVNLKSREQNEMSVARQVASNAVGYIGDLILENIEVESVFTPGRLTGNSSPAADSEKSWQVRNILFKNVEIDDECLSGENFEGIMNIDQETTEAIWFECEGERTEAYPEPDLITDLIDDQDNYPNIDVFPNPAESFLYIKDLPGSSTVSIYNTAGKLIRQTRTTETVDVKNLSPGLYFLVVQGRKSLKFIKK